MMSSVSFWTEERPRLKNLNQSQKSLVCALKQDFDHSLPSTETHKSFSERVQSLGTVRRVRHKYKITSSKEFSIQVIVTLIWHVLLIPFMTIL